MARKIRPERRDEVVEYAVRYERPRRRSSSYAGLIAVFAVLGVFFIGGIAVFTLMRQSPRHRIYRTPGSTPSVPYQYATPLKSVPPQDLRPVEIGTPKIDLKAVEEALWKTKTANPKDFKAWMKRFEDEANAIYFATLKQQNKNADPTTLMPRPLRVDTQRHNDLLHLYGYIDENNQPGYQPPQEENNQAGAQPPQDKLIFAFKQTAPYDADQKKLSYALYDASGYYYRDPGYTHIIPTALDPLFLGFFLYPAWYNAVWWRPSFAWFGTPMWWSTGSFYSRYTYYSGLYPRYYGHYRTTYYTRYRPWGWNRGVYYRNVGGRYYRPSSGYRSGYRSNYGSGYRSGYRSGSYGSGRGYRSSGSYGGSSSGYRSSYRSSGGKW